MGYASMSEITGRADLLQPNGKALHKTENLDLSFTAQMPAAITPEQRAWEPELEEVHAQTNTLDDELLEMDEVIAWLGVGVGVGVGIGVGVDAELLEMDEVIAATHPYIRHRRHTPPYILPLSLPLPLPLPPLTR